MMRASSQRGFGVDQLPLGRRRPEVGPALGEHVEHDRVRPGPVGGVRGQVRLDRGQQLGVQLGPAGQQAQRGRFPCDGLGDQLGMAGGQGQREHPAGAEAEHGGRSGVEAA